MWGKKKVKGVRCPNPIEIHWTGYLTPFSSFENSSLSFTSDKLACLEAGKLIKLIRQFPLKTELLVSSNITANIDFSSQEHPFLALAGRLGGLQHSGHYQSHKPLLFLFAVLPVHFKWLNVFTTCSSQKDSFSWQFQFVLPIAEVLSRRGKVSVRTWTDLTKSCPWS